MKAPKCRVCGVIEWRHVCGGGVDRVTEIVTKIPPRATKLERKRNETPATKPSVTKKRTKKGGPSKGGRPRVGAVAMTGTERSRLSRERKQQKPPVESGD
jgi:hypothetical protein